MPPPSAPPPSLLRRSFDGERSPLNYEVTSKATFSASYNLAYAGLINVSSPGRREPHFNDRHSFDEPRSAPRQNDADHNPALHAVADYSRRSTFITRGAAFTTASKQKLVERHNRRRRRRSVATRRQPRHTIGQRSVCRHTRQSRRRRHVGVTTHVNEKSLGVFVRVFNFSSASSIVPLVSLVPLSPLSSLSTHSLISLLLPQYKQQQKTPPQFLASSSFSKPHKHAENKPARARSL